MQKFTNKKNILRNFENEGFFRLDFHGDSITQGCGFVSEQQMYTHWLVENIKKITALETIHIYNHAVGGATSADGINRLHWSQREEKMPNLTFIMFGLNDIQKGVPLNQYEKNLELIIEGLKSLGSEVVLLSPTPFLSRMSEVNNYSEHAERIANIMDILFIDCLSPFNEITEKLPKLLWSDGLHLNAEGHKVLAGIIWKKLEPLQYD